MGAECYGLYPFKTITPAEERYFCNAVAISVYEFIAHRTQDGSCEKWDEMDPTVTGFRGTNKTDIYTPYRV